jgi:hypothetical protein
MTTTNVLVKSKNANSQLTNLTPLIRSLTSIMVHLLHRDSIDKAGRRTLASIVPTDGVVCIREYSRWVRATKQHGGLGEETCAETR